MKRLLTLLLVIASLSLEAAYTEFYIQQSGDNLNAGSTADDTAPHTYAGGTFVRATGVFTVASGNPQTDGVDVGDWASIYTTGETCATCIGRVDARDTTTITINLATVAGATANVSETANAATCKIGGAWKGPTQSTSVATNTFPCALISGVLTNASTNVPCINIKGGTTYNVTNALTIAGTGPMRIEGYTTTIHDGGTFALDGGTTYPGYVLLAVSGATIELVGGVFSNNGVDGATDLVTASASNGDRVLRCVFHDSRRYGLSGGAIIEECEAYACNKGNGSGFGGFGGGNSYINCVSHDHSTSTGVGFNIGAGAAGGMIPVVNCIAYACKRTGFLCGGTTGGGVTLLVGCDAYSNLVSGVQISGAANALVSIRNCNFLLNGSGITNSSIYRKLGHVVNCGFGTGTQTNTFGEIVGWMPSITTNANFGYAADTTPWVDPLSGNFKLATAAKSKGRGVFTQSTVGTVTAAYPDVGAAQTASTNTAAGGSYTFAQ